MTSKVRKSKNKTKSNKLNSEVSVNQKLISFFYIYEN